MQAKPGELTTPGPWRITFDTNPDDCNMACVMCEEHSDLSSKKHLRMVNHAAHRRMDVRVIRQVVAEMVPLGLKEIIPSTMGEPLLYSDFDEIVRICNEFRVRLNLTTNGTWPHRGAEAWGRLLCPVTSDVKVSWNGVTDRTQESIMTGSSMSDRVAGLRTFLRVRDEVADETGQRCQTTLQCTFMETNLRELPLLIEFAASLGIDRVKGHHLWLHFPELRDQDLRRDGESRRRWNSTVEVCREAAERQRRPDGTKIQLDNFVALPAFKDGRPPADWECPFLGKEAWVNHAGRFDPCCAPDDERRTLGYFGSVTKHSLREIWEGTGYRTLMRDYPATTLCQKCTMRRPGRIE